MPHFNIDFGDVSQLNLPSFLREVRTKLNAEKFIFALQNNKHKFAEDNTLETEGNVTICIVYNSRYF